MFVLNSWTSISRKKLASLWNEWPRQNRSKLAKIISPTHTLIRLGNKRHKFKAFSILKFRKILMNVKKRSCRKNGPFWQHLQEMPAVFCFDANQLIQWSFESCLLKFRHLIANTEVIAENYMGFSRTTLPQKVLTIIRLNDAVRRKMMYTCFGQILVMTESNISVRSWTKLMNERTNTNFIRISKWLQTFQENEYQDLQFDQEISTPAFLRHP